MTRISKQASRRAVSPRRPKLPGAKTGPKKEAHAFKAHANAVDGSSAVFIGKVK